MNDSPDLAELGPGCIIPHQRHDVSGNRLTQTFEIIASLQQ